MESTLAERSGISDDVGLQLSMWIGGGFARGGFDSQQRVSRFHILQLRFSNLRPSSIVSAHLEKTEHHKDTLVHAQQQNSGGKKVIPAHML